MKLSNETIRTIVLEIKTRVAKEQEIRRRLFESGKKARETGGCDKYDALGKEMLEADTDNTAWLKKVIDDYGFVDLTHFDKKTVEGVWLLAQHADHDSAWQKEFFGMAKKSCEQGKFPKKYLAFLEDRISVHEGRCQKFGTQLTYKNGVLVPQKLCDPDKVNTYRKEYGLETLGKYIEGFNK